MVQTNGQQQSPNHITLVTGPARSGKSEWAEWLAAEQERAGQSVLYVATSTLDPSDQEWTQRIVRHRQRRPSTWRSVEAPTEIVAVLDAASGSDCLLVDSLGTWLANGLEWDDAKWAVQQQRLERSLQTCQGTVILVAEETGWGVVPAYPLGRTFRDRLGSLIRRLGAIAHTTYLISGGHILNLSQLGTPLPHLLPLEQVPNSD